MFEMFDFHEIFHATSGSFSFSLNMLVKHSSTVWSVRHKSGTNRAQVRLQVRHKSDISQAQVRHKSGASEAQAGQAWPVIIGKTQKDCEGDIYRSRPTQVIL